MRDCGTSRAIVLAGLAGFILEEKFTTRLKLGSSRSRLGICVKLRRTTLTTICRYKAGITKNLG